jgi:hypothetical protein
MVARSPGAPPQRVCPHCSTLAYTEEAHCPWCGRSYRRRVLPWVAVMLLVTAAVVLGGVAAMLLAAGQELDQQLDSQVQTVEEGFDRDVRRLQRDIRRELDRRLPAAPAPAAP